MKCSQATTAVSGELHVAQQNHVLLTYGAHIVAKLHVMSG